ncbi:hypothetical protein [Mycobacteroides abscessus]
MKGLAVMWVVAAVLDAAASVANFADGNTAAGVLWAIVAPIALLNAYLLGTQ